MANINRSSCFFQTLIVFIFIVSVAAVYLVYSAHQAVDDYHDRQVQLSQYSLTVTENIIQQYIKDVRYDVKEFVETNVESISRVAENPMDKAGYKKLNKKIKQIFPEAATFTIADTEGEMILSDEVSLIGKGCRNNLRLFAISNKQSNEQLRIHSDRLDYHFDVMQEIYLKDGGLFIFFISFKPFAFSSLIHQLQLPEHHMFLLRDDKKTLIDISAEGSQAHFKREAHLSAAEEKSIIARIKVTKTLWTLVDLLDQKALGEFKNQAYRQSLTIFIGIICIALIALLMVKRSEKNYRPK